MKKEFNQSLREYYLNTFPNDELGLDIDPSATFEGLFETLDNYRDVYDYIGAYDSLIRERLFSKLAEIIDMDYDYIYDKWAQSFN